MVEKEWISSRRQRKLDLSFTGRSNSLTDMKTRPTGVDPMAFIDAVDHPRKREEAREIDAMMRRVSGLNPVM